MKQTILAGLTQDDELYFLEIDPKTEKHDYFSMSGFICKPITEEDAKQQVKEGLEDGEMWQEAVKSGNTKLGLAEWIEYVLDVDGELAGFDNSLYSEELKVDGGNWFFESGSCGQHEEQFLKQYFIPEVYFKKLMACWHKYHLKKQNPPMLAGILDDLKVEGWTKNEKQQEFIVNVIKNLLT